MSPIFSAKPSLSPVHQTPVSSSILTQCPHSRKATISLTSASSPRKLPSRRQHDFAILLQPFPRFEVRYLFFTVSPLRPARIPAALLWASIAKELGVGEGTIRRATLAFAKNPLGALL